MFERLTPWNTGQEEPIASSTEIGRRARLSPLHRTSNRRSKKEPLPKIVAALPESFKLTNMHHLNNQQTNDKMIGQCRFLFKPKVTGQKRVPFCKKSSVRLLRLQSFLKHVNRKCSEVPLSSGPYEESLKALRKLNESTSSQPNSVNFSQLWNKMEDMQRTCNVEKTFYRYSRNRFS